MNHNIWFWSKWADLNFVLFVSEILKKILSYITFTWSLYTANKSEVRSVVLESELN